MRNSSNMGFRSLGASLLKSDLPDNRACEDCRKVGPLELLVSDSWGHSNGESSRVRSMNELAKFMAILTPLDFIRVLVRARSRLGNITPRSSSVDELARNT